MKRHRLDYALGSRGTRWVLVDSSGRRWLLDVNELGALITTPDALGRELDIVLLDSSAAAWRVGVRPDGALTTVSAGSASTPGAPVIPLRSVSTGLRYSLTVRADGSLVTTPL